VTRCDAFSVDRRRPALWRDRDASNISKRGAAKASLIARCGASRNPPASNFQGFSLHHGHHRAAKALRRLETRSFVLALSSSGSALLASAIGIVGTVAGVVAGWLLTERSSARARREEQVRANRSEMRARQIEVALMLDDLIAEFIGQLRFERRLYPARPSEVASVGRQWESLWQRVSPRIADPALYERLDAVHQFLSVAAVAAERDDHESLDLGLQVELVVQTGRDAVTAYVRDAAMLPSASPLGSEWNWVIDHGPHESPWICLAAWTHAHRNDSPLLQVAAGARQGFEEQEKVPAFNRAWDWEGHLCVEVSDGPA
jgi:hypothetical protein